MPEAPSTAEIFSKTLRDARDLAQKELELARQELRHEGAGLRSSATALAVAWGGVVLAVSTGVTAIAIAAQSWVLELVLCAAFLVGALVAARLAMASRPRAPLRPTRERLGADVDKVKEHLS
jgi:hypothetical protein